MKKKLIYSLLFYYLSLCTYGQNIQGKVVDVDQNSINMSTLLVREDSINGRIKEFKMLRNGAFSIVLKKEYSSAFIEVKSNGYLSEVKRVNKLEKGKVYSLDFQLEKIEENSVEEVFFQAKKRSFKVKEDTVSFKVSAYKDGTERKIEDLIKKLPGIELDSETGSIKYNGVSIEGVTLDGDNLFGANYTLATKNVNIGMVKEVEAVNNYSENPLLKGIEKGGKVSLNLKLKERKVDFSGNLDYSQGYREDTEIRELKINLLGITKKYKSFSTLGYNNIGKSSSTYDYFTMQRNGNTSLSAPRVLRDPSFGNSLKNERSNDNNQFIFAYNSLFKIGSKTKVKASALYLEDKLRNENYLANTYHIEGQDSFSVFDDSKARRNPKLYKGNLNVKHQTSENSLLEYNANLSEETINTKVELSSNVNDNLKTSWKTNSFNFKNWLLFTQKLSSKKALKTSIIYAKSKSPQEYLIALKSKQTSKFEKDIVKFNSSLLGSWKGHKYQTSIGFKGGVNDFKSNLYLVNTNTSTSFNDFKYKEYTWFNSSIYHFKKDKITLSPSYKINYLKQELINNITKDTSFKNHLIFMPSLAVNYKFTNQHYLEGKVNYQENNHKENYFFTENIQLNNRNYIRNIPNLDLIKSYNYQVKYYKNDLYNRFTIGLDLHYKKNNGIYLSNSNIQENRVENVFTFLKENTYTYSGNLVLYKYFSVISSNFKLSNNYMNYDYKNRVNNSDLRNNNYQMWSHELLWRTNFDFSVNFVNIIRLEKNKSKNENYSEFKTKNIKYTAKIIIKPYKDWLVSLSSNYYKPNFENSSIDYLFLDANIQYRPKNKKWTTELILSNLKNEQYFEQINTSDIGNTSLRSKLLGRSFLLNFTYDF